MTQELQRREAYLAEAQRLSPARRFLLQEGTDMKQGAVRVRVT